MNSSESTPPNKGTRYRIVPPAAPAPVPEARPRHASSSVHPSEDRSKLDKDPARHSVAESPCENNAGTATLSTPAGSSTTASGEASASVKQEAQAASVVTLDREQSAHTAADSTSTTSASPAHGDSNTANTSDNDVVRSTGSMAIATLFSRITGFLRTVLISTSLGGAIASAFNTANTLPNLITEIVLGAVLTSLVVPVLIRAEKEDPDRGATFIRRLFTLAAVLLGVVTVGAIITAPLLSRIMLGTDGKVNIVQATSFAYILLPQIFFYGMFSLLMAVLNTKQIFKPGAWAPVANNVITIAVLVLYMLLPNELDPTAPSSVTDPHILLLGVGTTLGVVVQALIMIPPIRKAGISLKPLWGIDARLKQFGGMATAIIVYVAISQVGYMLTTRIASFSDEGAPNIYQQHWLLLQVPYGIIGVTLLTAIMPRLSRNAADGDDKAVVRDLIVGSKLTYIALIPIVIFFTAYGERIGLGLFAYRRFDAESATILGWTLSFSAFTLLPYALVLLHLRVFYAREEAWTPTFIIAGITGTKIVLSVIAPYAATDSSRVVILLGAANGFGFVAGAIIGAMLLRRKLGNLGGREVLKTSTWAFIASGVGILVALALSYILDQFMGGFFSALGNFGLLVHLSIVGIVFLLCTGLVLSRSGLEEVVNLGYALQRIPGMRRIIHMRVPQTDAMVPTRQAIANEVMAFDDTFNATPIPAPMSAGIVRGPRLVPGAQVSDGRFRLLADHGSVSTARFWQAREKATGREVALIFVDTSGKAPQAPATPAAAAGEAAEVSRRTRALANLNHPAIAPNIEVLSYRNGCLVVADWVAGSSLASVANTPVNPYAAAYAFEPISQAAQFALAAHTPLGIDNHARIRINTDGMAILAFPAVLSDSSYERDMRSIRTALGTLIQVDTAPQEITDLLRVDATELPHAIADLPDSPSVAEDHLVIKEEATPKPRNTPGFGSAGFSNISRAIIAIAVAVIVVSVALITGYITSLFGSSHGQTPLNSDPIVHSRPSDASEVPSIVAPIKSATAWSPSGTIPNRESTSTAQLAIDPDKSSAWSTGPLAKGQGAGLLITLAQPHQASSVVVESNGIPAKVSIYQVEDPHLSSLDSAQLLEEQKVSSMQTRIPLDNEPLVTSILVWVTGTPDNASMKVHNVTVVATS
ncbi:murein biosynthesis integral membrane protein MurJ [Corynebacterium pseudotuberculosis]|uniref:Murein biosynthesis integral membrane protein MurJ n=1 Tax=Corynebacterium pseudotuberculosis (strain C231) TaxID=681645 RepID=D9QDF5_CORP2|nr:murein biosynthesis integral membrane protein MurJ [Corynebacterium pseudotuberculosis]ADK29891.1 murein biosynthesis integral membrane protein MurJ [Corynebacterium pseudotuberculosis FRC41]ADL11540.1 murein biosynthesis integral membrane protein MurJ [Corynebacterium pseudotuberculosis C231]ADL21953.1 murein biosynthesis integral membrane protein MurJ [Corynebacterium pseudotuberculosis 1002]ADO27350.1 murein biosynthesis integral membrane protein MurJ [Corynebacterium pseudotuberculosis I